nr:PIN domain-containing protein [uncultured Halomonas sp.]
MRFVVIYDACVLYPAPLRDLLMRLATTGLFAARWTSLIHDEWTRSLLARRPELADKLPRTVELMNQAVPDALVTGHEPLIEGLTLPDPDDRHVLAAAIRAGAQLIVTFNLKDFPAAALASYGIEAVHPDIFLEQQFELHESLLVNVARRHRASLRNPPKSADEYLEILAANGLVVTADRLRDYIELL